MVKKLPQIKFDKEAKVDIKLLKVTKEARRANRYKSLYTKAKAEVKELKEVIGIISLEAEQKQAKFVKTCITIGLTNNEIYTLCSLLFVSPFKAKIILWYRTQIEKGTIHGKQL